MHDVQWDPEFLQKHNSIKRLAYKKKQIDDWALDYWLLQQYAKLCFRIYYRRVTMVNSNRIISGESLIIAPNHQNALMDAMVLVCNTPFQHVFLARADIFKGKRLSRFLHFTNIMPIYRIRDGIENVKRNDEVFEKTTRVLHNRQSPLIIFPEGNHGDKRRLRPLVKGLFRIAFQAQEKFGDQKAVKILPVGIDYGHYQNFRTTIFVNVGEPIEIADFHKEYVENSVQAINHLKDIYAERLSQLIIDIQTEDYYDLYMNLRMIFRNKMKAILNLHSNSLYDDFVADKKMIQVLDLELEHDPQKIEALNHSVSRYLSDLQQEGLRDWLLDENQKKNHVTAIAVNILLSVILFPVSLFGCIHNILPYWVTVSKARNIKDTQFRSTFKYVVGMIVFPIWYGLIAGVLAILSWPAVIIIPYLILLPITGLLSFHYFINLKKIAGRIRYMRKRKKPSGIRMESARNEICTQMLDIIKKHLSPNENQ